MDDNTIAFARGDGIHHYFLMPTDAWSAGGVLFFAAKTAPDDDNTDAQAVINQHWDDTAVTDVVVNGTNYKQYDCYFAPSATSSINSDGAASSTFEGEFQWVPEDGVPVTFPVTSKLNVVVYFDIKRKTTV